MKGRVSIFVGVATEDVGEQQVPAFVAPEGFQTHQAFITRTTPKLARSLEPTLILPTGRFHRAAAHRFARSPRRRVIHPLTMAFQIRHFGGDDLPLLFAKS